MNRIAIITARGGSKRIPNKNIRPFLGRPIIEYSIKAALDSGLFNEVMVSTDSEEIAKIAGEAGAKVPFLRSGETATDTAPTAVVLLEVLNKYKEMGQNFDTICCIYPTAPFITPAKLQKAVEILETNGVDTVVPVVRYSFPPQRAFVVRNGLTVMSQPENALVRSQDLEPMFHDCGQFYCLNGPVFLEKKAIFTDNTMSIEMPETQVQDIDNEVDWELAELKYKIQNSKGDRP